MSDDALQSEIERLRAEVESHRQRELADLRAALAVAREEAVHYRQEAERNAAAGRQIASSYQQQVIELTAKLNQFRNTDIAARRDATRPGLSNARGSSGK